MSYNKIKNEEVGVIMEENKKPMGLYVHIPFCSRKCDYCDFVSFSMDEKYQVAEKYGENLKEKYFWSLASILLR